MKKNYLLLSIMMFVSLYANAQFFHHLYGTTGSEYGGNGLNTNATGMGHFIVSTSSNSTFGELLAVNTDVNGNPSAFNNIYSIVAASGVTVTPRNTLPIEFSNGNGYGVFGMYYDPSSSTQTGIYYLELDVNGNVLNTTQYNPVNISSTNFNVVEVADVTESTAGGDFYITGTVDPQISSGSFWVFILKINQAGNVLWSTVYDLVNPGTTSSRDWAKGIIESPYTPNNVTEVVVVGHTYGNGSSSEAFFMRLNANNGAVLASPYIYGNTSTFDQFTSIKVANSTAGGSNGFIIGGNSDAAGFNWDFWMLKADPVGNVFWSGLYDYNGGSANYENCTDVMERLNTSSAYEYYVSGTTNGGNIGGTDLVVIKTDDNGNPYANGQFTYGSNIDDGGAYLDQYNGTPNDGLSVFGTFTNGSIGSNDAYHVKAYFNGLSGCNEDFNNTVLNGGPGLISKVNTKLITKISDLPMSSSFTSATDATLCFNTSISGGSNARLAQPDNHSGLVVSPNPMETGNNIINVAVESETETLATIQLYDMLGRTYYNQKAMLTKGKTNLPLDISNANLAAGTYTLKISSTTTNKTILLMVK